MSDTLRSTSLKKFISPDTKLFSISLAKVSIGGKFFTNSDTFSKECSCVDSGIVQEESIDFEPGKVLGFHLKKYQLEIGGIPFDKEDLKNLANEIRKRGDTDFDVLLINNRDCNLQKSNLEKLENFLGFLKPSAPDTIWVTYISPLDERAPDNEAP